MIRLALAFGALVGGCGPTTPDGWTRQPMADGAYSLAVPSGVTCSHETGVDSDVARCAGGGLDLALDWGRYGGVPPGAEGLRTERVGGRDVVVARELGVTVYHFETEPVGLGDGTFADAVTLTAHARCGTEPACETARQIVRSVRF